MYDTVSLLQKYNFTCNCISCDSKNSILLETYTNNSDFPTLLPYVGTTMKVRKYQNIFLKNYYYSIFSCLKISINEF